LSGEDCGDGGWGGPVRIGSRRGAEGAEWFVYIFLRVYLLS